MSLEGPCWIEYLRSTDFPKRQGVSSQELLLSLGCVLISKLQDSATAMVDVLHAIQYLHEIGLVHRDLKVSISRKHPLACGLQGALCMIASVPSEA